MDGSSMAILTAPTLEIPINPIKTIDIFEEKSRTSLFFEQSTDPHSQESAEAALAATSQRI
jgi:hypothetical protein